MTIGSRRTCRLASGVTLPDCRVAYRTFGRLSPATTLRLDVVGRGLPAATAMVLAVGTVPAVATASAVGVALAAATASVVVVGDTLHDLELAQEQKLDHICRKLMLKPGERFEYTSWTRLATPQGTMRGTYFCMSEDARAFDAPIAEFMLARPEQLH